MRWIIGCVIRFDEARIFIDQVASVRPTLPQMTYIIQSTITVIDEVRDVKRVSLSSILYW